ncbi:GNAT family N-acetyltransferase [Nocardioides sp. Soil805]|uniref:GNAT family N-acetyltransferase n=1 Tax=Nocardioides sp. Soil805 TaxID=1736416 RepID=UPI000702F3B6|nr:GNAT family N-acetyltransferase [Nocardioides sp. Soil805]KRF35286.1 aromatic ring-opening dioxygenase LigA [Nocardioides sp. Soil805]
MLWRVRLTLPDRPGALATLASECGTAGVNILGLQVFPGIDSVTDELVLEVPEGWDVDDIASLVERAGARAVVSHPCTEAALVDQPARYVAAARTILAQPARFPEVVAQLFDAEAEPGGAGDDHDSMEMTVNDVSVQVHRRAPFTATEHARGVGLAELVSDVLARSRDAMTVPEPGRRLGTGATPEFVASSHGVSAMVDGTTVGRAVLAEMVAPGSRHLHLEVDPAWRRRGIGSRLLLEAARAAAGLGDDELVLVTSADNQAVLPMVLGSGLRGRIRMSGDGLTVRVPLRDLEGARG